MPFLMQGCSLEVWDLSTLPPQREARSLLDCMRFMLAWFFWWRRHCYSPQYFTGCSTAFTGTNLPKMAGHTAQRHPVSLARTNHAFNPHAPMRRIYAVSYSGLFRWRKARMCGRLSCIPTGDHFSGVCVLDRPKGGPGIFCLTSSLELAFSQPSRWRLTDAPPFLILRKVQLRFSARKWENAVR